MRAGRNVNETRGHFRLEKKGLPSDSKICVLNQTTLLRSMIKTITKDIVHEIMELMSRNFP